MPQIIRPFAANHFTLHYQQHHHLQLTPKQLPSFSWLTTPLPLRGGAGGEALFALHHFPFHYQQHHHLQLTPKQLPPFPWLTTPLPLRGGAGGEALFPLHHFIFNYQPRHPHNYFILQLRWYCAIIPMDEFRNINALMVQLGTSCSFDSPGLARNEPTPGKRSQGDSTPSVLSFFCESMLIIKPFMTD